MRRIPRILAFVIILASCGLAYSQDATKRLLIVDSTFDFGTAPQNSTLTYFSWFKAVGKDTVKITKIQTGCDCTTMPLERDWIAPGDSMLVGVYWKTERKIGSSGRYPYIWIAGQADAERMIFKAEVNLFPDSAQPVSIKPFRAEFSKLGTLSVDSVNVVLTNRSVFPLKLIIASPTVPEIGVQVVDSLPPHGTGIVSIAVSPAYRDTEFERSVTVAYSHGQDVKGRVTIPVRRKIIAQPGS